VQTAQEKYLCKRGCKEKKTTVHRCVLFLMRVWLSHRERARSCLFVTIGIDPSCSSSADCPCGANRCRFILFASTKRLIPRFSFHRFASCFFLSQDRLRHLLHLDITSFFLWQSCGQASSRIWSVHWPLEHCKNTTTAGAVPCQ